MTTRIRIGDVIQSWLGGPAEGPPRWGGPDIVIVTGVGSAQGADACVMTITPGVNSRMTTFLSSFDHHVYGRINSRGEWIWNPVIPTRDQIRYDPVVAAHLRQARRAIQLQPQAEVYQQLSGSSAVVYSTPHDLPNTLFDRFIVASSTPCSRLAEAWRQGGLGEWGSLAAATNEASPSRGIDPAPGESTTVVAQPRRPFDNSAYPASRDRYSSATSAAVLDRLRRADMTAAENQQLARQLSESFARQSEAAISMLHRRQLQQRIEQQFTEASLGVPYGAGRSAAAKEKPVDVDAPFEQQDITVARRKRVVQSIPTP